MGKRVEMVSSAEMKELAAPIGEALKLAVAQGYTKQQAVGAALFRLVFSMAFMGCAMTPQSTVEEAANPLLLGYQAACDAMRREAH